MAAAFPVGVGLRGIAYEWTYASSVTLAPNEAMCGNPIPFMLIFVLGPILGLTGGLIGLMCAAVLDLLSPIARRQSKFAK